MTETNRFSRVLLMAGVILIAVALALVLGTGIVSRFRYDPPSYYIEKLTSVMPPVTDGIPEEREDSRTATYEVDGLNFAGIIEMPDYNLTLPVYGSWETEKLSAFPCLLTGSADSSNLIIGSTSKRGQFSFVKQISLEDRIVFTDMTGVRYTYYISDIRHSESADFDILTKNASAFVLFIKNPAAFEYIIVSADAFLM